MKAFLIFFGTVFVLSAIAFCIAAMIQMSHPWEAPWWMFLTVQLMVWSVATPFVYLIAELVIRRYLEV